jgi:hemoglobin
MAAEPVPSLFEWAGGMPALERLTQAFYDRVRGDPVLAPIFAHMSSEHPRFVAEFIAEVLGGPTTYSATHGGHPHMIARHLGRHLTESQRKRWVMVLLETADEVGLPSDPEFRSALVGYLEWGSRIAVLTSNADTQPDPDAKMPHWDWGPPGGPYQP